MLLDSNVIIYAAKPVYAPLRHFVEKMSPMVSAISRVEVLGYHSLCAWERHFYNRFFGLTLELSIGPRIIHQAVYLRQQRSMSLGDSLIAATALVHELPLVTFNQRDFRWIPGLRLFVPEIQSSSAQDPPGVGGKPA